MLETEELEQALLSAFFLGGPKVLDELGDLFRIENFGVPENRHVAEAICELIKAQRAIDCVTVNAQLQARGLLGAVPAYYSAELASSTGTAANARHYAELLASEAQKRKARQIGNELAIHGDAEKAISALTSLATNGSDGAKNIFAAELTTLERLEAERNESDTSKSLIPSGFKSLDFFIGGFRPGLLYVFAARPGSGKSSLAAAFAENIGMAGIASAAFWLEDDSEDFATRLLQRRARVPSNVMRHGKHLNQLHWEQLGDAASKHAKLPIYVDDSHGLDANQIAARMRRYAREYGCKVFLLDHLGEISLQGEGAWDKHHLALGKAARIYRDAAKDLGCVAVLFCQMGRSIELRQDPKPQLRDIEGSDQVGQVARFVGFVKIQEDAQGQQLDKLNIDIVKNTKGPRGTAEMRWNKALMSVEE